MGASTHETSWAAEAPTSSPLPGGIFLLPTLLDVPYHSFSKVQVLLYNMSTHDVTLYPNRVIAEMMAAQHVTPVKSSEGTPTSCGPQTIGAETPLSDKVSCCLTDSPILAEWKNLIMDKLKDLPEVFAVDDLAYGCTSAVKHKIRPKR